MDDQDLERDAKVIEDMRRKTLGFLPQEWKFLEDKHEVEEKQKMLVELVTKKWDPIVETIWEHANRKYWITYRCQDRHPTVDSRSRMVKLVLSVTTTHFTNWDKNERFKKIYCETKPASVSWREMRDRLMELEKEYRSQESKWNENYLHEFETHKWSESKMTLLDFMKRKSTLFKLLYGEKPDPDKKAAVLKQMLINTMPDDKNHLMEHVSRDIRKRLKELRGEELTEEEKHILPRCCRNDVPNTKKAWNNEEDTEEATDAGDDDMDCTSESEGEDENFEQTECDWCQRVGHRLEDCEKAKIDGYVDNKGRVWKTNENTAKEIQDIRKGRIFCLKCKQDGHYQSECNGMQRNATILPGHKQKYIWDEELERYRLNTTKDGPSRNKRIRSTRKVRSGLRHWARSWDTHRESGSETD